VKKLFILTTLACYTTIALAQYDQNGHQKQTSSSDSSIKAAVVDAGSQQQLSQLLSSYYNIKNSLVAGDANSAASNADQFLRTANTIDFKVISEGNIHILSNDAGKISSTKDLKKQRDYFATLSSNVALIAKAITLGNQPVYVQYCPMKKALWLSSEKQIRNPYYGSSMLTCGEVTETIVPNL